ncbi:MAG: amidohydrolase [Vicinamibacteraceae bacterium]|nr:amidohydrolase [Vicinamibacteraceae bacterium]
MPTCDTLLEHAIVITMDGDLVVHPSGYVATRGSDIVAVGAGPAPPDLVAAERLDCTGLAVMPGLVNAHTHAAMTLLRGIADDLRLDVWLQGYIMPVEREFVSPDFVRLGTSLACAEMIRSGVTLFADMYYFEETVAEATAEAGLRALCGQTVLKFPSPDATSYEDSLARAREFIATWKDHPLIVPAPAPHAPYTCTAEILRAAADLAVEFDVPIHTHLSETLFEVEQWRRDYGMPVIPWVKKQGLLDAKVLAAHCVHIDEGEMRTLKHAHAGVAHNPSSNLKLGSGIAPVVKMLEAGVTVGIGTDGPASNNDLDMFEEMRLAALLQKGSTGDPTALPARDALLMATRQGAEALHLGHLTGSLVPGRRADLAVVDVSAVHNTPTFDRDPHAIYARLVYATKSSDVRDVMCHGRWLMRDRALLTLDEPALMEAARGYARRTDTFLIEREGSVLSKLVAIGGAVEQESFEVQVKARVHAEAPALEFLAGPEVTILKATRYHQYDTWFFFADPQQGRLRIREEELLDAQGGIASVRARLTLTGQAQVAEFGNVLLFRSRFLAPATHTRRFYREYFKPVEERDVEKDRRRWLVAYRGVEFYVHLDHLRHPAVDGYFLEVKSRTWSRRDAEDKAALITELMSRLGASPDDTISDGYVDFTGKE